jgi:hypothetical protein
LHLQVEISGSEFRYRRGGVRDCGEYLFGCSAVATAVEKFRRFRRQLEIRVGNRFFVVENLERFRVAGVCDSDIRQIVSQILNVGEAVLVERAAPYFLTVRVGDNKAAPATGRSL